MDQKDILDQLEVNVNRNSALETLMQVDAVLDSLNVYAFKIWMEGEIIDGPHIERYWSEHRFRTLCAPHQDLRNKA